MREDENSVANSPEQQLVDMAETESDPNLKELLLGTAAVKMVCDTLVKAQTRVPSGYRPSIYYTDMSGIEMMWKRSQHLLCPQSFKTEAEAQRWVDAVLKYWETPKMAKKVKVEHWGITKEFCGGKE